MATKPSKKTAPVIDFFGGAQSLPTKVSTDKSKSKREQVTLPGIEKIATLDVVAKAAKGMMDAKKAELEDEVIDHFLSKGFDNGRPESFDALDGNAKANVRLQKKASNVALNESEVKVLRAAGVEPHREVVVPALFAFNPEHMKDQDLMRRIQAALAGVEGIPHDLIVRQDEVAKYVVTDAVADAAWKSGDYDAIRATTTLAYTPTLEVVDVAAIAETMRELFTLPEDQPKTVSKVLDNVKTTTETIKTKVTEKDAARRAKYTKRVAALESAGK